MTTILFLMAYALVGGLGYSRVGAYGLRSCHRRNHGDCGHSILAGLCVFFWPLVIPVVLGVAIGNIPTGHTRKEIKNERRREWELEEAQHKAQLAKYALEENRALERRLKELRIKA